MKVALVSGSREWTNQTPIWMALDSEAPDIVVHGSCETIDRKTGAHSLRGADRCADDWARRNGVMLVTMPALFEKFGKAGGPLRNSFMVKVVASLLCGWPNQPHQVVVVAAPLHGGSGTRDLIAKAKRHDWRIRYVEGSEHEEHG